MVPFPGWTFDEYVAPSGQAPFSAWLATVPEAQDFIDERILTMRGLRKWSEKWASKYKGTDKIVEMRVTFQKVEYRLLGIYAPGYRFVFLGGGIEKGKLPPDLIKAVVERQKLFESNPRYARRYRFHQK